MDGLKTTAESFVRNDYDKCIAGVVAIPENDKFRIYVAWGWESMAKKQHFAFSRSRETYKIVNDSIIEKTANYGYEMYNETEIKKLFGWLL
ncbi:MAG: hypothetical protein WC223_10625 [Bacteroidales bacterium]|jgi:hypothetical protein